MRLRVNSADYDVEVPPRMLLVHVIRDRLNLTGTKIGCEVGKCGACTVLWNGIPIKSCMMFGVQAEGAEIQTIEGLSSDPNMRVVQRSFSEHHALQCGYCTPGMLISAYSLLKNNPSPTEEEIKSAMSGNLCTCTGYVNIITAVKELGHKSEAAEKVPSR